MSVFYFNLRSSGAGIVTLSHACRIAPPGGLLISTRNGVDLALSRAHKE